MNDYYSPYKAVHHEDRIKQLRAGDIIDPVFAQIDLTIHVILIVIFVLINMVITHLIKC